MARNSCPFRFFNSSALANKFVDRQGRHGRRVSFDSYKRTKSTVTRIGLVQSQEEWSRDSEAGTIGGERMAAQTLESLYVASGSISSWGAYVSYSNPSFDCGALHQRFRECGDESD